MQENPPVNSRIRQYKSKLLNASKRRKCKMKMRFFTVLSIGLFLVGTASISQAILFTADWEIKNETKSLMDDFHIDLKVKTPMGSVKQSDAPPFTTKDWDLKVDVNYPGYKRLELHWEDGLVEKDMSIDVLLEIFAEEKPEILRIGWTKNGLFFPSGQPDISKYLFKSPPEPIPEPSTMLLFGSGLAGIWLRKKKRL